MGWPMFVDVHDRNSLSSTSKPPLAVMKELFSTKNGVIAETMLEDVAKKVLLTCNEYKIWLSHLQTVLENRRRGAKKAAATRRARATRTEIQETRSCPGKVQLSSHTLNVSQV